MARNITTKKNAGRGVRPESGILITTTDTFARNHTRDWRATQHLHAARASALASAGRNPPRVFGCRGRA